MVKHGKTIKAKTSAVPAVMVLSVAAVMVLLPAAIAAQLGDPELDTPEAAAQLQESLKYEPLLNPGTSRLQPNPACGGDVSCYILKAANWIVDAVFYLPFILAEYLFGWVLGVNLAPFSAGSPITLAVNTGFRVVLAVANMAFILILLWIAIATIFDFESFTARKTLPKFIIAALLINFSLPIGKAIINLGNGTANIFYENLLATGGGSVRGVIQRLFKIDTLQLSLINPVKNDAPECRDLTSTANKRSCLIAINKTIKGIDATTGREMSQQDCVDMSREFFRIRGLPEVCSRLEAQALLERRKLFHDTGFDLLATVIAAKILIYPVAIFVLFAGAIFLINRLVVLTFILILGPIAFLGLALPATERFYNDWWNRLIKWSLFLPAFLFFFWLTFAMINGINNSFFAISASGQLSLSTWAAMGAYLLAAAFMIGSLIVANQFGIAGASTVTGWGKKMAGGLGKWAADKAGRMTLAGVAPAAKAIEETQNKFLRRTLLAVPGVRRGLQNITAAERKQIGEREKYNEKFSTKELQRRAAMATTSQAERGAISRILIKRRDFAPDADSRKLGWTDERVQNTMRYLNSIGEDMTVYERVAPHLAVTGTPEEIIKAMRPSHLDNMDRAALENVDILKAIAKYWKQAHYSRMISVDPRMRNMFQEALEMDSVDPRMRSKFQEALKAAGLDSQTDIIDKMDDGTYEYFVSSSSLGYGYSLPAGHQPPPGYARRAAARTAGPTAGQQQAPFPTGFRAPPQPPPSPPPPGGGTTPPAPPAPHVPPPPAGSPPAPPSAPPSSPPSPPPPAGPSSPPPAGP